MNVGEYAIEQRGLIQNEVKRLLNGELDQGKCYKVQIFVNMIIDRLREMKKQQIFLLPTHGDFYLNHVFTRGPH